MSNGLLLSDSLSRNTQQLESFNKDLDYLNLDICCALNRIISKEHSHKSQYCTSNKTDAVGRGVKIKPLYLIICYEWSLNETWDKYVHLSVALLTCHKWGKKDA